MVSGGFVYATNGESSYPMIERSSGTRRRDDRAARSAPSAMTSDPQTIAVWPAASSWVVAACPPSSV